MQLQGTSLLTTECLAKNLDVVHKIYPSLSEGFYDILCERLKAHGFSDRELTKAVNHVIDTCKYPQPTIAEFISYLRPDGVMETIETSDGDIIIDPAYEKEREDFNKRLLNEEI
jgi:hypothetical protein